MSWNDATNLKDETARPEPGCLSVCMKCSGVMVFDDNLGLRVMTDADKVMIPEETMNEVLVMVAGVREFWRRKMLYGKTA